LWAVRVNGPAHSTSCMHNVVIWIQTSDNGRKVLVYPSVEIILQKSASIGVVHN
jgi:hypothetical protein